MIKLQILLAGLSGLSSISAGGGSAPFTYHEDGKQWKDRHDTQCNGDRQSPIDFQYSKMSEATAKDDLVDVQSFFDNVVKKQKYNMQVKDVTAGGHALHFDFAEPISDENFKCPQFHFHIKSSEHTYEGKHYLAEAHLVCHRAKFADLGAAVNSNEGDALFVFGTWVDGGSAKTLDDPAIAEVIKNYQASKDSDESKTVDPASIPVNQNQGDYYRYKGSLTTPECNEVVIWTMFKDPIHVSPAQSAALTGMTELDDNNRMTLPLGTRVVTVYSAEVEEPATDYTMYYIVAAIGIVVIAGLIFFALKKQKTHTPGTQAN